MQFVHITQEQGLCCSYVAMQKVINRSFSSCLASEEVDRDTGELQK
jgi:hypothetical protein